MRAAIHVFPFRGLLSPDVPRDAHVPHLPARPEHAIDVTAPFSSQAACQREATSAQRTKNSFAKGNLRRSGKRDAPFRRRRRVRVHDKFLTATTKSRPCLW